MDVWSVVEESEVKICNHLGIQSVADVVSHGRLIWFGHLERKGVEYRWLGDGLLKYEGGRG